MKLRDGGITIMAILAAYWIVKDVFVQTEPETEKCAKVVEIDGATYTKWGVDYCEVFDKEV